MAGRLFDRGDDIDLVFRLLDEDEWRQRLVEHMELGWGDHVRVDSRYQFYLSPQLVGVQTTEPRDRMRALIPVTTRPKRPLMDFHLSCSTGSAPHLLVREHTANIETAYVVRAINHATNAIAAEVRADRAAAATEIIEAALTEDLIYGICAFNPAIYDEIVEDLAANDLPLRERRIVALAQYLKEAFGHEYSEEFLSRMLVLLDRPRAVLLAALDEEKHPASSSETLLLALPFMEDPPFTEAAIENVVLAYDGAIHHLNHLAHRNDGIREELMWPLGLLAEYGRRWEMIIDVEVPLGQPFTIAVQQNRLLGLTREAGRGWCTRQRFAAGDAYSAHLQARVHDHSVSISAHAVERVQAVHGDGTHRHPRSVNIPLIESVVHQQETYVLYTAHPQRPYYMDVILALKPTGYVAWALMAILGLTAMSSVVITLLPTSGETTEALAVLTIPVTIAAAFVLTREQSALSAQLQKRQRAAAILLLSFMWILAVSRALAQVAGAGWATDRTEQPHVHEQGTPSGHYVLGNQSA